MYPKDTSKVSFLILSNLYSGMEKAYQDNPNTLRNEKI